MNEERILAKFEEYKMLVTNVYELAKEIYNQLDGLEVQEDMLQKLKNMVRPLYELRQEAANELIVLMRCINTLNEKK
jgi:DNA repair ATPase RecN